MLSVVLARLVRRYCGERQGFKSCIGNDARFHLCIGFNKKSTGGMRFAIDYSQESARIDFHYCYSSGESSSGLLCWNTSGPPRTERRRKGHRGPCGSVIPTA
jgi:hypothetical protein